MTPDNASLFEGQASIRLSMAIVTHIPNILTLNMNKNIKRTSFVKVNKRRRQEELCGSISGVPAQRGRRIVYTIALEWGAVG
jgi:hypothetical protein